jgi:hypothetical protein
VTRDEITSGLVAAFMAAGYAELAARRLVPYLTPALVNAEAGTVTNPNYPHWGPSALGPACDFIAVPPDLMAAILALPAVAARA